MDSSQGPKVDIPDELAAELQDAGTAPEQPEAGGAESAPAEAEASAGGESDAAEEPRDELAEIKDKYLRLAAEFDNFKRRTLRERQDLLNYGNEILIKELLPTVDNLERALGHARQEEAVNTENLSEGVELTHRSLLQALEKSGVQIVDPTGGVFDPKLHEALRQVPSPDHEPGAVIEVYQKGYLLRDRLLRPALVAVAGPAEKPDSE